MLQDRLNSVGHEKVKVVKSTIRKFILRIKMERGERNLIAVIWTYGSLK